MPAKGKFEGDSSSSCGETKKGGKLSKPMKGGVGENLGRKGGRRPAVEVVFAATKNGP